MYWQARDILIANGYDCRIVSDSVSGKTSSDLVTELKKGEKKINQADMVCFTYGINDSAQNIPDATLLSNWQFQIAWAKAVYGNPKIVFIGNQPVASSALVGAGPTLSNTRLAQIRANMTMLHNPSNNVYYVTLENAITDLRPNGVGLFTDDVHLNQAGHDLCGPVLGNLLKMII